MKKVLLSIVAVLALSFGANAQEEGKFRVGFDLGYTVPKGGGGVSFGIEPKYNLSDNMNIGIRFAAAAMAKDITSGAGSEEAKLSTNISYLGTYDYYFNNGASSFAPFLGVGAGYYSLANVELDTDDYSDVSLDFDVSGKFGGMIRGGFEAGKFRLTLEYNLIPKSDIEINGEKVADVKNGYFGVTAGFYFGGGKWKK